MPDSPPHEANVIRLGGHVPAGVTDDLAALQTGLREWVKWTGDAQLHERRYASDSVTSLYERQRREGKRDYPGAWGDDPVQSAVFSGMMRRYVSDDHLSGLAALINVPEASMSLFGLVRMTLDSSLRASLVLDPGLDVRQRIARGHTDILPDIAYWIKSNAESGSGKQIRQEYVQTIKATAEHYGFKLQYKDKQVVALDERPRGLAKLLADHAHRQGEERPRADLVAAILQQRYSSMVHGGMTTSVFRFAFKVDPDAKTGLAAFGVWNVLQGIQLAFTAHWEAFTYQAILTGHADSSHYPDDLKVMSAKALEPLLQLRQRLHED